MALTNHEIDLSGLINEGKLELERPIDLPNGTPVIVRISPKKESLAQCLKDYIGSIDDPTTPSDLSSNLDHYMYGAPKE